MYICRVGNPAEGLANGTAAGLEIMELILDGNSDIGAQVSRKRLTFCIPKPF